MLEREQIIESIKTPLTRATSVKRQGKITKEDYQRPRKYSRLLSS
jgi:hypothetical protein